MLPEYSALLSERTELAETPSKTFAMEYDQKKIIGFKEGRDAFAQTCFLILNTERYQYPIYSRSYGTETWDLFGELIPFVCAELERRITEAILQDERAEEVTDFLFDIEKKNTVHVRFIVHSLYGETPMEREVILS